MTSVKLQVLRHILEQSPWFACQIAQNPNALDFWIVLDIKMIAFTPFSRTNRALLLLSIVCLITTVAATVFVAARSASDEPAETRPADSTPADASVKAKVAERFGRLPLSFERNEGQVDPLVKFLSHGPGYDLFLTGTEAVLSLQKPRPFEKDFRKVPATNAEVREISVLRLKMIGANADAKVEGHDELPGKVNYFVGNDPEKWRRNISTYRKVYFKDVYPGIDIVYYGNQRQLEYDFVIAPGANPKVIKFRVEGADRIRLDESGSLLLALKDGDVRLNKPFIYQLAENGGRSEVKGAYSINGNEVSFKVRGFDARKPLVIDPVLSYSTFLGSSGNDQAFSIAVDSLGSAYLTGVTSFSQFPTTAGAFQATGSPFGGAFVSKLDPTGSSLVYSTYLSGRNGSTGTSIAVDSAGNAYVTGQTSSMDFPIVNGLKTSSNFFKTTDSASSWNNNNSGLVPEPIRGIAVAANAPNILYAVLTGGPYRSADGGATWTKTPTTGLSSSFASTVAVDPTNSSVVYLAPFGGGLAKSTNGGNSWSLIAGTSSFSSVSTIVFDPVTPSTMYVGSTTGVFKSIDSGTTWTPLSSFGVSPAPSVRALAIDPTAPSTIYAGVGGGGGLFKTTNGGASWTVMNSGMVNAVVVNTIVIDPSNSQTVYAGSGFVNSSNGGINKTTNGGASWAPLNTGLPNTTVTSMVVDRTNALILYAATAGGGIIKTTNGGTSWAKVNTGLWKFEIQTLVAHPSNSSILFAGAGGDFFLDAFVTKLNPSGSGLLFSTFLGGSNTETGDGIAVDGSGNIYVVGTTLSQNFPAVNAFQSAQVSPDNCNSAFVSKINPSVPSFVFSTYLDGGDCDQARAVALDSSNNVYVTGSTRSADFPVANAFQSTKTGFFETDAFVTKLTTTGSLVYSTYLGGFGEEHGFGIAVDAAGNAHVAGMTTSSNFPTLNPIQAANGGGAGDVFVTKFNSQGSGLIYSTYLGGSEADVARGIVLDSAGNAYIAGSAYSVDFPLVAGSLVTKSGLYKSVNGAASWSNNNYGLKSPIFVLAVHPTQPTTLYAGTDLGVFKSTNGGKNWTPMNNGLTGQFVRAIVIDPLNPSTLYAGTVGAGTPNNGVYKSTDGGSSWNLRKTGLTTADVTSLAIDPATPTTLYAAGGGVVFKTTNGADNWAPSGTGGSTFAHFVAIDPKAPSTVFASELFSGGGIWRSIDSGATWQKVNSDPNGPREGIIVSPLTAGLVYATGNSGAFKSVDNGNNWTQVRNGVGFGRITFDPVSASTVYLASGNEGVLKSTDNGQTWVALNNGIVITGASAIAIDPLKPSTLYAVSSPLGNQEDAFVTKINPAGSTLIYSTLIGGPAQFSGLSGVNDTAFGIAVDAAGNAYVAGLAGSLIPTTPNSYQPFNRGGSDAFIAKLTMSHIISGHVKDGSSAPVTGAEVVLNDGTSIRSITSESDGSYEFSQLRQGGNFTVSASKPHFTIAPTSQTFNNLDSDQTLDFTATATNAAFHTISGQITNNGVGLANATVTLSGSQSGLRTTDSNGNYSFELAAGGNYTITPSIVGFAFAPLSQIFNNLSASQTANFAGTRQNFVVTNTNNHGTGSLREAITNANATVGLDTIVFNIPGSGVKLIKLLNLLPEIIDPVVIDGTTQPGYAGLPLVELDGTLLSSGGDPAGLKIKAGGTTVRGLALGGFSNLAIWLNNCDNNVIQANHVGIDATGTVARPNATGLRLSNSSNNVIGGTTAAARNVISGNRFDGIELGGSGNVIQGNYIGTNAAGTAAIPNDISGVNISSTPFSNNLIGGTAAGARNVISGNQRGVSDGGTGTTIQGNLIGTDVTGTQKVPNGVGIMAQGPNAQIGGLTPAARNIISGNNSGVFSTGAGNKIQGNYIGTDITGNLALSNTGTGVVAGNNALIGGTTPEARNIIAANGGFGNIALGENNAGTAATVQGNYIGTDVTGTKSLQIAEPTTQFGITVFSNNHVIGGTAAGARNIISGNDIGIQVGGFSSPPNGTVIQGNLIGLNAQGNAALPNSQHGIRVEGADNTVIGGTQNGAANTIAFSGGPGVQVTSGTGTFIRGNSIFSNGELGIDLGFTKGVTANDPSDIDVGPNNLQNFPVLTSVSSGASSTTIQGSLNSRPNTSYQIDFYTNSAVDPSGNGEGALFFNTTAVNTDGSGNATINITFPAALPAGRVITATATDPTGNTSEFSAADATGTTGSVQFTVKSFFLIEDLSQMTVTVQRVGGSTGSVSVDYATADGTAIAGQDYTATSGTLNFASGEISKTFQVPILNDATTETDETFTVLLRNPSTLEALGMPNIMTVIVQDQSTVPFLAILSNPAVVEGDTGTTRDARFEVLLSAATGRTVSVNFATANINAHGGAACGDQGVDYESKSGTITFQPGTNLIAVPVKVCGDSSAEANEQFSFQISNPVNATLVIGDAIGAIFNDDVIQLLLEDMGPGVNQAAALDALRFVRDPFSIVTVPEMFAAGTDRNTRVLLFVRNLQLNPGETSSAVVVRLIGSNNQIFDVPAEDFRAVPGFDFMQVVFRLPTTIPAGTAVVTVRSHGRVSNIGTIRIVP
jgi:photosystem II stability/assembly factor-like uncharacterized protein